MQVEQHDQADADPYIKDEVDATADADQLSKLRAVLGHPDEIDPGAPASMGSGMMMRMIFTLMDSDGDGSPSLEEFQAAHARIFKMDANKDGKLTIDEMQTFMQGARRSAPRQ
jgi:hypothetical protein